MGAAFDEVVAADIGHDLRARKNLGVELLLNLAELLQDCQQVAQWSLDAIDMPSRHSSSPSCRWEVRASHKGFEDDLDASTRQTAVQMSSVYAQDGDFTPRDSNPNRGGCTPAEDEPR